MPLSEALQRTLEAVLLPPASLFVLAFIGLLFYGRVLGKLLAWVGLLGLFLMSIPLTSHWLGRQVETIPPSSAQQLRKDGAQAILVLTAGEELNNPELDGAPRVGAQGMERLSYALRLHRQTGLPIIISGGGQTHPNKPPLAEVYADWLRLHGNVKPLALEERSLSTWQNLEYSAPLLRAHHIQKVALVTHAYHMRRALYAARAFHVDAIPAPFGYISHPAPPGKDALKWKDWLPNARTVEENYLLIHEWVGTLWYRLFYHATEASMPPTRKHATQ